MKERPVWPERGIHEKYLLGLLSEEKTVELERQYFADDELFEQLVATETDLLDEYARGELADPERAAFEKRLMSSPSLRGRLESAATLRHGLKKPPAPGLRRRSEPAKWVMPLLAAAALLFAAVGLRLAFETTRLQRDLESTLTERGRLGDENRRLRGELAAERPKAGPEPRAGGAASASPAPAGRTVSFTLAANLRDVAGSNDFVVPRDASAVLLEIPVGSETGWLYRVRIETPFGRRVLEQQDLRAVSQPKGSAAVIAATRDGLPAGDYVLKLGRRRSRSAFEDAGDFAFHIAYR